MLALVDVHYTDAGARAACLLAEKWASGAASSEWTVVLAGTRKRGYTVKFTGEMRA
jgi:hypothetical protein